MLCNKREFLKRTDPSAGIFTNRPGKSKLIGQMLNPELFVAVSESNVYWKQSKRGEKVSLVAGNAGSTLIFRVGIWRCVKLGPMTSFDNKNSFSYAFPVGIQTA